MKSPGQSPNVPDVEVTRDGAIAVRPPSVERLYHGVNVPSAPAASQRRWTLLGETARVHNDSAFGAACVAVIGGSKRAFHLAPPERHIQHAGVGVECGSA